MNRDLFETPVEPSIADVRIDAHQSGAVMTIDMFAVPKEMRGRGLGRAAYEAFEQRLPPEVERIELFAATTGDSGSSAGFWDKLGFEYKYTADEADVLTYDESHWMWKGVGAHPTPASIHVTGEED